MLEEPTENKDKEIWRRKEDDYYSPSIHVTHQGDIGINVGGYVIVKSVEEWHFLAKRDIEVNIDRGTFPFAVKIK